jgi:predicted phosphodiesterase
MPNGGLAMRTLVIGDLHCPADVEEYLEFCKDMKQKYKTNQTIFIGDIIDHEAISMHDKNPNLPAPGQEFALAVERLQRYYKAFKNAKVCIGNHDARVIKKANKHGIPELYLKSFSDLYQTPCWEWDYSFEINGVFYTHGDGWGGKYPSFNAAQARLQSVVCGHHHSLASINWIKGPTTMYFGMNVGCGVDQNHLAFKYSKAHLKKSILSCGVVIDGNQPYLEIM